MPVLILVLLAVAAVALFSVQNAAPVAVAFLFWRFEASLAVIVLLTLLVGGIAGAGMTWLSRARRHHRQKRDRTDIG